MFGVMFLIRLAELAVALVFGGLILVGFAKLLNQGIQWTARQFGYEVGDFFGWIRSILPKKKKKRGKINTSKP